ncbi:TPA: hypothetical protein DDZ01_03475 [Candidatus Uhrbacteria bacterium]|nr:MAG: hypothetical protein UT94_C0002G0032 [Candidatus Uhrbacteria bacterium GW2011_GWF2_40_263]OGL97384.1 MAG: hypothetical protein A2332_04665 [Candidatus Uhrbacteria bacterium RIFOXYB2_FULL_41_18]HBK35027.1 hypothetical protein [Candidatus Uhrbacteria bacterium]HCB56180.1 hypothetical protein [Candidatus Uhrbacteria bacterium]
MSMKTNDNSQLNKRMQEIDAGIPEKRISIDYSTLEESVSKWLLLKDKNVLRILMATVIANKLQGDPVWLLIVCASGGSKTELLRGLNKIPNIYNLSDLTPQTFLSGMKGENASLLSRIDPDNTIMVMKDFTTVLTMHRDKRQEILGQLREIYDGYIKKAFGTGETKEWHGKLGFIAGVTTVIDRYQTISQVLGERFIQYHLVHDNALVLARKSMSNSGDEKQMREEIQESFANFIAGIQIPEKNPDVSGTVKEKIIHLATFCVRARSGVFREGYSRDIEFVPDPELPTRFTKELAKITSALSLIDGRSDEENYNLVFKIGLDSIPQIRRNIISKFRFDDEYETSTVASMIGYTLTPARRALEELEAFGLVKRRRTGKGLTDLWSFSEEAIKLLTIALPDGEKTKRLTVPDPSGDGFDEAAKFFEEAEQETLPDLS